MSEPINPYLAPSALFRNGVPVPLEDLYPAGEGRRCLTLLIDQHCSAALVGAVIWCQWALDLAPIHDLVDVLLGLVLYLAYYIFFESIWGRTPGKFIVGTAVLDNYGQKPSLRKIVMRSVCRLIPFDVISIFFGQPWHDSISQTVVVLTPGSPAEKD